MHYSPYSVMSNKSRRAGPPPHPFVARWRLRRRAHCAVVSLGVVDKTLVHSSPMEATDAGSAQLLLALGPAPPHDGLPMRCKLPCASWPHLRF